MSNETPPGMKELTFGPPGSGKTHSIRTWLEADPNLEVCCLFLEPSGMAILNDCPAERLHWVYVAPAKPAWKSMIESARLLNTYGNDKLQALDGIERSTHAQWIDMLVKMSDFTCERCGKKLGPIDSWGTDKVFVLDGMSGLNILAMTLKTGTKPLKTLPDWGAAMDLEETLINRLTLGQRSHVHLIAHAERESDQLLGGIKTFPVALGRKLPQTIGRFFDDVVYTNLSEGKWTWSTVTANVESKARYLPLLSGMPPSFKHALEAWKKKGGIIQP